MNGNENVGGMEEACRELSRILQPDLRLLMHGSGDVPPNDVNDESVFELANLTVQYMVQLVEAAVDAHDILTDGAGGTLPPPPPPPKNKTRKRKRHSSSYAPSSSLSLSNHTNYNGTTYDISTDAWDEYDESNTLIVVPETNQQQQEEEEEDDDDEWMGVVGVDFTRQSRIRTAVACTPNTIHTQCFIFPICHDRALYGRVMEIQAARRNLAPLLMDPVLLSTLQEETPSILADTIYRHLQIPSIQNTTSTTTTTTATTTATSPTNTTPTTTNSNNGKNPTNDNNNNNNNNNDGNKEPHRVRAQAAAARNPIETKFPGIEQILPTHRTEHLFKTTRHT